MRISITSVNVLINDLGWVEVSWGVKIPKKIKKSYFFVEYFNDNWFIFVAGGIVANLSDLISETKNAVHMIANEEGKEKFYLTEEGLLYTKGPLDREERDSYMFTVLAGRRGLPRGFRSQQAFQVKVGN